MKLGETYVLKAIGAHLWVVVTLPDASGSVVIVNFTSHQPGCDESCVIEAGEHPFVVHKTVVAYKSARVCDPNQQGAFAKNANSHPPVSESLLKKIQDGVIASDFAAQKVQKLVATSMAQQAVLLKA